VHAYLQILEDILEGIHQGNSLCVMTSSESAMIEERDQSSKIQRNLELVVQTGLLLAKHLDLPTLVQVTTDAGLQLCGAQFGAFLYNVIDDAGERYLLYTPSDIDREKFAQFPIARNTGVFVPMFEETGIVRSGDITKDPRYSRNTARDETPVRSYLAVPVHGQSGEVLGGLFYGHEKPDIFQQNIEDLVAAIAAQAAIAMENLRLREQLTRKFEESERAQQYQRDLAKRLSEVAAIVESSDDAIVSKDLTGHITSWNPAAARIFGYSREEILGKSILLLIPKELHHEEKTILSKIRAGERIDHYETVRVTKGGERLDVSLSISPVRDGSGTIVGASKILRDISAKKRTEASLLQAEKIAAAGRMAATIAHEVNNPLEAVMNLIYLAKSNAEDPEEVRTFLSTAEGEVARVSHIAKQTLGFYRETDAPSVASLSELATHAIRIYGPKCKEAGIKLEEDLNSTRQVMLRKGEIMQVISNLLANAIYAMPTGGTLSISVGDIDSPTGSGVLLTVKDTGVGIPAEQLPRIFEAFFTTRISIGTGIGLFVAKQFVEGHGGKIYVESSTDPASHGTKMSIFLPLENPQARNEEFGGSFCD
jgi:PAS domain S-box-containing protein